MSAHQATNLRLNQQLHILEVAFADGNVFKMSCEYLRVYSPSAEVMGHGLGEGTLQLGKEEVNIISIEQVGNYAVKMVYDDGHSTGIYTWDYLYDLGVHQDQYWQRYLERLVKQGHERKSTQLIN